jgi:hypothetical protein
MEITRQWVLEEFRILLRQKNINKVIQLNQKLDDFFFGNLIDTHKHINHNEDELYSDLELEAFSTPYIDYYQVLADIPCGEVLIDLGGGYGRGCFLAEFLGGSCCISIEKSSERVQFSNERMNKLNFVSSRHINADLVSFDIPSAFAYYLYFPRCEALDQLLLRLSCKIGSFIYSCESHGDLLDYLDQMKFLTKIDSFDASISRHNMKINKYRIVQVRDMAGDFNNFPTWLLFNKHKNLVLEIGEYHLLMNKEVVRPIHVSDIEYIFYNGKISLQQISSGRVFCFDTKTLWFDLDKTLKYSTIIKSHILKNEKVLISDKNVFIERNSKLIKIKIIFQILLLFVL